MALDTKIIYANYVESVKAFKKMAGANKKLVKVCDKLLRPSGIQRYAIALQNTNVADEDEEDENEVEAPKEPEEFVADRPKDITEVAPTKPEHDFFRNSRFPFADVKPNDVGSGVSQDVLRNLNDRLKKRRGYFDSSLQGDFDFESDFHKAMESGDMEKQFEVLSVMLFKYLNVIPERVVASIINSPATYLPIYMNPNLYNIAPELRPLCNKKTINSTIDALERLKEGNKFSPNSIDDTSYVDVIDNIKNVLVNENGIYFGEIEDLKNFIYTGASSSRYVTRGKKVGKNAEDRFKQGLHTLVNIVAAQQLCLKYGDIPSKVYRRNEAGQPIIGADGKPQLVSKFQKRHVNNAPHPTEEFSVDRDFAPHKDRWRTVEHMNKRPEEAYNPNRVMEYGVTKDEENLGFNDEDESNYVDVNITDPKMISPAVYAAATQVAERLGGVVTRMVLAPAGGSFKLLYAFYAACRDRKGRLSGKGVETMQIDADLLDFWQIPYDESRLTEEEVWLPEQEEYVTKHYVSVRVAQHKSLQALWRYYQENGLDKQSRIEIRNVAVQWQWVLQRAGSQHKRDALARHMVNVLHDKLQPIYIEKAKELASYRSRGEMSPFHKTSKNKMQDADKDWLEAAVILTTLRDELPNVIVQDFVKANIAGAAAQ